MSNKLGLDDNERVVSFDDYVESVINRCVLRKLKSFLDMYKDGLLSYEVLLIILEHELDRYEE